MTSSCVVCFSRGRCWRHGMSLGGGTARFRGPPLDVLGVDCSGSQREMNLLYLVGSWLLLLLFLPYPVFTSLHLFRSLSSPPLSSLGFPPSSPHLHSPTSICFPFSFPLFPLLHYLFFLSRPFISFPTSSPTASFSLPLPFLLIIIISFPACSFGQWFEIRLSFSFSL